MRLINCFDVVDVVVQEATERFAPVWEVNTRRYNVLKQYCSIIDSLSDRFGGESYEVEIDETKMTISIKLECLDMTIKSVTQIFYGLADQAEPANFTSNPENGNLIVEFVFPSIWKRAV